MTNEFGPQAICKRTACVEIDPHKAGRHLDQRDELYDGPDSLLQVLPLAVRDSARRLVREAPALMPEVVDLAEHIEFLRGQVAHASVDKDRQVREAMARSESCEHHGQEIRQLSEQVHHFDRSADKHDRGRIALLGGLQAVRDFTDAYRAGKTPADLTVEQVVSALEAHLRKAYAAHERAWK